MTKVMTPSEVKVATAKQINKAVANYRAMLEKHASEFQSVPLQMVLGQPELAKAQFELLRARVDAMSEIIIRRVKVDRSLTPQQVVDATGYAQYVNDEVLATMPTGEGDEAEVWFIPTKHYVPISEVPAFLAQFGLVPDPRAQAAVNKEDPAFVDKYQNNNSLWGDSCCLVFYLWGSKRCVSCHRRVGGVYAGQWLAGVPVVRQVSA